MGGDHAPQHPVAGAVAAAAEGIQVLLVGDERALREELTRQGAADAGIEIVHAPDVVSSGEDGARAVRAKPESSIATACRLVGEGRAGAAVSVGNTGAMLAAATLYMRRIPGVIRPAIAVVLPATGGGSVLLLDAGASAESRPEHFPQLALMGRLFMRDVVGVSGAARRPPLHRRGGGQGQRPTSSRPTPSCVRRPASWATWRGATSRRATSTSS